MPATLTKPRNFLGSILVERGYLTVAQLEQALSYQSEIGGRQLLGEVLLERSQCTDDQIAECLALQYSVPYAKLDPRLFDPKTMELVPREFMETHTVLPMFKVKGTLTVALAEPANLFVIDELKRITDCEVQVVAATATDIHRMIQACIPNAGVFVIDDIIDESIEAELTLIEDAVQEIGDLQEEAAQSPIVRLVNYIIYNAVKENASDVHFEPTEKVLRIRFRIDGTLHKALEVPVRLTAAVTSRIKIMANMDISERRLPQDGRIHVLLKSRPIDLRVSICPMVHGEKIVVRVLDNSQAVSSLTQLGFRSELLTPFQEQIVRPNGIVLVTGPTGSGKSTTLYAALHEISTMEKNICTVEDPVEYHLNLINQLQVKEKIGLSFSSALRSLLRQDPDVIMLGEVRDEDTARTAIQAAMTGHLVFTTLHTNDACSAIMRLVNMSVEPYLIAAALNAVLAQRLVRRICSRCKEKYNPPRPVRTAVSKMGLEIEEFCHGVGCKRCRNTGYSGRIGIHELLVLDDTLREHISTQPSLSYIRARAKEQGMTSLRYDGLTKVKEGLTTVEEVFQASDDL
ncbi:MAG: Flp pilus assembly complex ATPase component TadA [Planctomycetes bacterium]|nr:Flp pilus assembly complex ATPase component TadA [Planctomycetota bacterium]